MELDTYLRFVLALIFVLGLIGALALLARRFGVGGRLMAQVGDTQRLQISEVRPLDARHKLVLVRRDATEHLILLGPSNDLVVERGIPGSPASSATAETGPNGGDGQ